MLKHTGSLVALLLVAPGLAAPRELDPARQSVGLSASRIASIYEIADDGSEEAVGVGLLVDGTGADARKLYVVTSLPLVDNDRALLVQLERSAPGVPAYRVREDGNAGLALLLVDAAWPTMVSGLKEMAFAQPALGTPGSAVVGEAGKVIGICVAKDDPGKQAAIRSVVPADYVEAFVAGKEGTAVDEAVDRKRHAELADARIVPGGMPGGIPGEIPVPPPMPGEAPPRAPGGIPGGIPPPVPGAPPPRTPTYTRVSGGVLAKKARVTVQPQYPKAAADAGVEGAVVVEVTVDRDGNVENARVLSGHPLLRDAAVDAARQWTFSPTRVSGVLVKVLGTITFNFVKKTRPGT